MATKKSTTHSRETTSTRVATIASKGLREPASLTNKQIKTIAASALTQTPDKKKGR
jgi:carnitine O-acetyltransferase